MPRLDDAFDDESPGQPILICNQPGVEIQPFLLQAVTEAQRREEAVIYLTTDRPPSRLLRLVEKAGGRPDNLLILDGHSSLYGIPEAGHVTLDPSNIADVVLRVEQVAQEHPGALFIMESLNGLALHGDLNKLVATAPRLVQALCRFPHAIVAFTQWHEEVALRPLLQAFPHEMVLSAVEDRIITSQYFRIERISGRRADGPPVLFRADEGSVRVYVPKVVVTGPADVGKSTFVHAVSDRAVSTERMGATVALDKGTIDREGLRVDLFGTPGQERFDPMLVPLMRHAVGVVLIVDSTDPAAFDRAVTMLRRCWRTSLPVVLAANKQDLPDALSPDEVGRRLALEGTPVVGCNATDPESARRVLDLLLDRILSSPEVIA